MAQILPMTEAARKKAEGTGGTKTQICVERFVFRRVGNSGLYPSLCLPKAGSSVDGDRVPLVERAGNEVQTRKIAWLRSRSKVSTMSYGFCVNGNHTLLWIQTQFFRGRSHGTAEST
jgi:hypothetical protein